MASHYNLMDTPRTGDLSTESSRSEQVVKDYKKHKLAHSALRRIHDLIEGFEQDRLIDRKLARIGLVVIVLLIVVGLYLAFGTESLVIG